MTDQTGLRGRLFRKLVVLPAVLLAFLGPLALRTLTANAESTKTVFSPFTGKLDYITAVNGTNFASGSGVTVSCTAGVCTFSASGSSASNLEVFSGVVRSSPTATINLFPNDFIASLIGATTFQFALNPATTDFIHNQTTAQTATFNVSSGSLSSLTIGGGVGSGLYALDVGGKGSMINVPLAGTAASSTTLYLQSQGAVGATLLTTLKVEALSGTNGTSVAGDFSAGPAVTNYGIKGVSVNGTTGYGGYFSASGNSDKNYGLYVAAGQAFLASSATVAGAGGAAVTYGLTVGTMTGAGLSTCGDSTHGLGWSAGTFSCQSITGSGGGGGGYNVEPATVTFNLAKGVIGTTATFSGPALSTFTYGLSVGSLTVTGAGDGGAIFTISGSTYGVVSSTAAIPSTHLLIMNSTNYTLGDGGLILSTQTVTVTISSGTGFNGLSIPVWRAPTNTAVTIVKILAESLASGTTVLYQLDSRAFGSINSAGTNTFSVAFSTANNTGVTTTSFSNASISANNSLVLTTPAAAASAGSPTAMTFTLYYNRNTQ